MAKDRAAPPDDDVDFDEDSFEDESDSTLRTENHPQS